MSNPAEVAVNKALLDRLIAYAVSPAITVALPEVAFDAPTAAPDVRWLRATFLPAPSFALGVGTASNQHYGILQVDVFYNEGQGEYPAGRIAADIIAWFKRGTKLAQDGFGVHIYKHPYRSRFMKDPPWIIIPVSIPYIAFAPNPA